MRIAVAQLKQEANHFNPQPCELKHFEANGLHFGEDVLRNAGPNMELGGALSVLRTNRADLAPLMLARSVSYGPLTPECFAHLKNNLLQRLDAVLPVDGVYISFHGAMAVADDDDPEGTVLEAVRQRVGDDVIIATSYDLHAHMSPLICANANIVEGYRTYPHDDGFETGARAAEFLVQAARREIMPVLSLARMNMLVPGTNQQTAFGPASLVWYDAKQKIAEGDALSVSIFFGHSKLDVPEHGFAAVVMTDGDRSSGAGIARELSNRAWNLRHEFAVDTVDPDEAVVRALAVDRGPVVLVDLGDVPGGGAPGDSNAMLRAMLNRRVENLDEPSQVIIVDPEAVDVCHQAGVGSVVRLEVGGKVQNGVGAPLPIEGVVRTLHDGRFVYAMGNLRGSPGSMGRCAVIAVGAINVILASLPSYEYADEQYRAVGLDMDRCRISVARAGINFKWAFKARARHIILVGSPGPTGIDLTKLPFTRISRPTWPFDDVNEPTITTEVY